MSIDDDLARWLRAQIAEDERRARAALRDRTEIDPLSRRPIRTVKDDGVWTTGEHAMDDCDVDGIGIRIYDEGGHTQEQAVHIAAWSPARVLAECEAKRRAIAIHAGTDGDKEHYCPDASGDSTYWNYMSGWAEGADHPQMCTTLRLLALPYADRPGYREEWRP